MSRGGVDTLTGSYSTTVTASGGAAGLGPVPNLTATYNSNDYRVGPLGPGWTHSYATHIAIPGAGTGAVVLVGPQGRSDRYTPNSDGTYTPPPGVSTALARNSDGTFTGTFLDQTTWTFDTGGKLTAVTDRYTNQSALSYNSSNQLTSISDPAGRGSLSLSYNGTTGRLTSVTDWLGSGARTTSFGYDSSNRMSSLTDRAGHATTFAYDGAAPRLTTITDARPQLVLTNAYDQTTLRVSTQTDALSNQTSYSYPSTLDGTTPTVVTYPTTSADTGWNAKAEDTYTALGLPPSFLIRHVDKPASSSGSWATTTFTYDGNGFSSTVTDPKDNVTTFCFDRAYAGTAITTTRGNLGRVIAPTVTDARSGGSAHPVTLYQYDSHNNLTQSVAPNGVASSSSTTCTTDLSGSITSSFVTDNTYDTPGVKLVSTTRHFTDPDLGAETATTQYQYNDSSNPGRVTAVISPRNNTTTFTYYPPTDANNQDGLLSSATGPAVAENSAGNKTTYFYDSIGRRTSMVDPLGNISGGTASDHTWTWSYDAEDRLTTTKAPAPQFSQGTNPLETDYQYDNAGNRTVRIDAHPDNGSGQVTKYVYTARAQLQEVQQSSASWTNPATTPSPLIKTLYSYDALGNLVRVDRDGTGSSDTSAERVVDYAYDGLDRVTRERQYPASTACWPSSPNGSTSCTTLNTAYTYDLDSNRATLVDPLTQTTTFGLDALNRLTGITYTGAVTGTSSTSNVSYTYDLDGNRHSMADTATTNYCYDELDRLTSTSTSTSSCPASGSQIQTGYRYDLDGNRSATIYPGGTDRVSYTYDAADRVQRMDDWTASSPSCSSPPTTGSTCYTYVPDSRLAGVANHNETTTTYTWDNARRLQDILHKDGTDTLSHHGFTLDPLGNRTHFDEQLPVLSAPGLADADGTLAAQRLPGTSTDADLDELVAATTDAVEPVAQGAGAQPNPPTAPGTPARPTREQPLQDSTTRGDRPALFHAEPKGHTLDVFDKSSPTASVQVQHAWTKASLRLELPGPAQQRVALGNKATAQVGDLGVTWTSFDTHLKEDIVLAKQPASNTITFNVQMKGLAFGKDGHGGYLLFEAGGLPRFQLVAPTVKDAQGRSGNATLTLTLDKATITVDQAFLASASYPVTIDPTINYVLQTVGTTFTYDNYTPVSQLLTASADQDPFGSSTYTFDQVRNRATRIQGVPGNLPQLDYSYDRADRLLSVMVHNDSNSTVSYTWNANGNLTARSGGGITDSLGYDQANRLTSATITNRGSGTYTYDGDGKRTSKTVSSVTTNYVYDVAGGLPRLLSDGTHRYVWGAQGLAYNVAISGGAVGVYHADQIGSIREITSSDGSVHTAYLTDEYGNRVTTQGTVDQPFQFTGELADPETGFVYLRARYYEPQTGRFVARDLSTGTIAAPASLNRFAYVAGNPINFADPSGLAPWDNPFCTDPSSQIICNLFGFFPGPGGSLMASGSPAKNFDPFNDEAPGSVSPLGAGEVRNGGSAIRVSEEGIA